MAQYAQPARPPLYPPYSSYTPTSAAASSTRPPPTPSSFVNQSVFSDGDLELDNARLTPSSQQPAYYNYPGQTDNGNGNANRTFQPNVFNFNGYGNQYPQPYGSRWQATNNAAIGGNGFSATNAAQNYGNGDEIQLAVAPMNTESSSAPKSLYFDGLKNVKEKSTPSSVPSYLAWCVACDNMCCNKNRDSALPKCPGAPYFQCCNCCCCFMICHYRIVRLFIAALILFLIFYFIWAIIQLATLVQTQQQSDVAVNTITVGAFNILQTPIPATANAAITIAALWPISLDGLTIQVATQGANPMALGTITLMNTGLKLTKGTNNVQLDLQFTPAAGLGAGTAVNILLTAAKALLNGQTPLQAVAFTTQVTVTSTALLFAPIRQTVTPGNGVNLGNTKFNIQFPT